MLVKMEWKNAGCDGVHCNRMICFRLLEILLSERKDEKKTVALQ